MRPFSTSRQGGRALAGLALLALFATPTASALAPQAFQASLQFHAAVLDGVTTGHGEPVAFHAPPDADASGGSAPGTTLGLEFRAGRLEIHEERSPALTARPPRDAEPPGPRATHWSEAEGRSLTVQSRSDLLLVASRAGAGQAAAFTLNRPGGVLAVEAIPGPDESFSVTDLQEPGRARLGYAFSRPEPTNRIVLQDGSVVVEMRGDFTLHLYGVDVQVDSKGQGRQTFRSGPQEPTLDGSGPPLPHEQVLRLVLHNSEIRVTLHDREARLHLETAALRHEGTLRLEDAHGRLQTQGATHRLEGSPFSAVGTAQVTLTGPPPSAPEGRVPTSADLVGDASALSFHAASVEADAVPVANGDWGAPAWTIPAAIAVALLGAAFTLYRRRTRANSMEPDAYLHALAAFRDQDYAKAMAAAGRSLRHRPQDVDAQVVKSIALVRLGRPDEAYRFARTCIAQAPPDVGALAYVAALAAAQTGRTREGAEWLAAAVHANGELVDEAFDNPLLEPLRRAEGERLRQSGLRRVLTEPPGAYA